MSPAAGSAILKPAQPSHPSSRPSPARNVFTTDMRAASFLFGAAVAVASVQAAIVPHRRCVVVMPGSSGG